MEPLKQHIMSNGDEFRIVEKGEMFVLYKKDGKSDTVLLSGSESEVLDKYDEMVEEEVCRCGRDKEDCGYPECEAGIQDRLEEGDLEVSAGGPLNTSLVRAEEAAKSHSQEATTVADTENNISESDADQPHDEEGNIEPSEAREVEMSETPSNE